MKALTRILAFASLSASLAAPHLCAAKDLTGSVVAVSGTPQLVINGTSKVAAPGDKVIPGTTLKTGPADDILFSAMPGTLSRIEPNTEFVVDATEEIQTEQGKTTRMGRFNLKSGGVYTTIEKARPGRYDYRIKTAQGVAAARGTTFYLGIQVVVSDGEITFTFPDGTVVTLPAGSLIDLTPQGIARALRDGIANIEGTNNPTTLQILAGLESLLQAFESAFINGSLDFSKIGTFFIGTNPGGVMFMTTSQPPITEPKGRRTPPRRGPGVVVGDEEDIGDKPSEPVTPTEPGNGDNEPDNDDDDQNLLREEPVP